MQETKASPNLHNVYAAQPSNSSSRGSSPAWDHLSDIAV